MHARIHAILAGACLALAISQTAAAQADDWQYEATLYMHAAAMDGNAGVRGVTADVDMSFNDIWDHLDAGFMGMFTARRGPWILGLDLVYMKLADDSSKSVTGPFGKVTVEGALDLDFSLSVAMASVGYRLLDGQTKLDMLGGLRYTRLEADAKVKVATVPPIVFPGGAAKADGSEHWVDGVVGLRALHPVTDQLSLVGYLDAGAGGTDFTYQVIAGVNWEFKKDFIAKAGYRQIYWDYDKDGNTWDMTAAGPYLGLGIRF